MKGLSLVLVFVGALAVFLAAGAPLSVALDLADARARGLGYADASGTVWRGTLRDVRVAGQPVGDVALTAQPWSLTQGALAVSLDARGALRARGEAQVSPAGAVTLANASVVLDARDLARLHPELAGRGGEVFIQIDHAAFDAGRACRAAAGAIQTDVLARGDGAAWRGPPLAGAITCEDGALAVALGGAEAGTDVDVQARLHPGQGVRVLANVKTESPEVAAALLYLGFQEGQEGFSYAYGRGDAGAS